MTFVNLVKQVTLDLKKQYAVPVYDRNNIHNTDEEESMSGLSMNVDKTKAVWIGSRRNSKLRFMPEINLDWNPVTFTVLGVVFSTDILEMVTINFENKLNEMKKVLNAWSRRNLTPFGRITVIKSLVISS